MSRPTIRTKCDRVLWERHINEKFRRLQVSLFSGASKVTHELRAETPTIVSKGLRRPTNQSRHPVSLAEAIQRSLLAIQVGRRQFGVGIRVTHPPTLDRLAMHWHAIEVGSDHLVGTRRAILFGIRVGGTFLSNKAGRPSPTRQRQHPDMIPGSAFGRGKPITRPIEPHRYLEQISQRAISRFSVEVDKRIKATL